MENFNAVISWPEGNSDSRREMDAETLREFLSQMLESISDHAIWNVPVIIEICQH